MNAEVQDLSDNYDKISCMPDSILIHILTFLKAKEAVQTCLLSKRWIDLWAYLPSLKFDSEEFENDMIFERFVSSFLLLRKTSHLDTFQLSWHPEDEDVDTKHVTTWVVYAIRCKPRVLSLYARSYDYKDLPHSIFCCVPLEELKLILDIGQLVEPIIPRSINLPFLRKLILESVDIDIEKLLKGCSLLEELELQYCYMNEMKISSPSLKYLTVIQCSGKEIIISCPNIINLHLDVCVSVITLRNLFSLKRAVLYIDNLVCSEILNGLSHAMEIELFGMGFKTILAKELPNCSTFKNLSYLVLDVCLKYGSLDVMDYFLQCSPNLDNFYFSDFMENKIAEEDYSTDSEDEDVYGDDD